MDASESGRKRVLVAEGNDDIRSLMKIILEMYGYAVMEARNGSEALEKARDASPHLILIEVDLPGTHGLDSTRLIRKFDHCSEIPIIAMAAPEAKPADILEAGCSHFVRKPLTFEDLPSLVNSFLR